MSKPFVLQSAELCSLSDFPLRWRWTDPKYDELPAHELSRIQPLSSAAAERAWRHSLSWHSRAVHDARPSSDVFRSVESLERPHEGAAQTWLEARLPAEPESVVVSWQPDLAILTDSALFAARWESFCYPASDDTDVWPLHGRWVVTYWHEERLFFGRAEEAV
jgi:hypothetical protein